MTLATIAPHGIDEKAVGEFSAITVAYSPVPAGSVLAQMTATGFEAVFSTLESAGHREALLLVRCPWRSLSLPIPSHSTESRRRSYRIG